MFASILKKPTIRPESPRPILPTANVCLFNAHVIAHTFGGFGIGAILIKVAISEPTTALRPVGDKTTGKPQAIKSAMFCIVMVWGDPEGSVARRPGRHAIDTIHFSRDAARFHQPGTWRIAILAIRSDKLFLDRRDECPMASGISLRFAAKFLSCKHLTSAAVAA
jgi:hypothetical protein